MELQNNDPTISVTIGNNLSFALDKRNSLMLRNMKTGIGVNLGPLTKSRASELSEYLQRLAIHTPER